MFVKSSKPLIKYLKLTMSFFKASFMADIEYRTNITIRVVTDMIWYVLMWSVFKTIFLYTPTLSGWQENEIQLFLGTLYLADSLFMIFFSENLDRFAERVKKGEIDLVLVKPVQSQFFLSLKKISTSYVLNFFLLLGFFFFQLIKHPELHQSNKIWFLAILIPCGTILIYSTRMLFATTSLIFVNTESLNYLWFNFYRLGTRPHTIYNRTLQLILMTIFPSAFFASVPALAALNKINAAYILITIFITGLYLYLTHLYWNFALKNYASASS